MFKSDVQSIIMAGVTIVFFGGFYDVPVILHDNWLLSSNVTRQDTEMHTEHPLD
jgi:hypothetical protein